MAFLIPLAIAIVEGAAITTAIIVSTIIGGALEVASWLKASRRKNAAQDRQADVLTLTLGEGPRFVAMGPLLTAGHLLYAFTHGTNNDYEVQIIKVSDTQVTTFAGFYVGDLFYGYSADGAQASFTISGTAHLNVWFLPGTASQTIPASIVTASAGKWTAADIASGCAVIIVEYKANDKVWSGGRPNFKFQLEGMKLYDPRIDSTVPGGSGLHRFADPTTWSYSTNLALMSYNFLRGVYNGDELMVGPGLSADEAPGEDWIAAINACDTAIPLKAGGTQLAYHGGAMIRSDEPFIDVLENFAQCMGGMIVPTRGGVLIQPGFGQSVVASITDADIVEGTPIIFSGFLDKNNRVNTVIGRYVEPYQFWEVTSAPMRRDYADVTTDGRPYEETIELPFVQTHQRAQRIAEIERRKARLERTASLTLPARFANVEAGDWIDWTSSRYLGGDTVKFLVEAEEDQGDFRKRVRLREIETAVYTWTAASDELTPGTGDYLATTAPGALAVTGFTVAAATVTSANGTVPAIKVSWTAPADPTTIRLLIQVRKSGGTDASTVVVGDPSGGVEIITQGIPPEQAMEVRARFDPRQDASRDGTWTAWTAVTSGIPLMPLPAMDNQGASLLRDPYFQKWAPAAALPTNWVQTGTVTVAKTTTTPAYGSWWFDCNYTTATGSDWHLNSTAADFRLPGLVSPLRMALDYDIELVSGDFRRSGVLIRVLYGADFYDYIFSFWTAHGNGVVGQRYQGTLIRPVSTTSGTPAGAPTAIRCYVLGNYIAATGGAYATKRIRWGMVRPRLPTVEELKTSLNLNAAGEPLKIAIGAVQTQATGDSMPLATGVQEGECEDGVAVTFATAYPVAPRVIFLGGGKLSDTGVTSPFVQEDLALAVSTTGFTPSLKLKNTVGATTLVTMTFGAGSTTRVGNKAAAADAWNGKYVYDGSVIITGKTDGTGEPYSGQVDVVCWSDATGGGFIERGRQRLVYNHASNTTATKAYSIEINPGALGTHGGNEFQVTIQTVSGLASTGSFTGAHTVKYYTATAPTSVARTTADQKVKWRAQLGLMA